MFISTSLFCIKVTHGRIKLKEFGRMIVNAHKNYPEIQVSNKNRYTLGITKGSIMVKFFDSNIDLAVRKIQLKP